MHEMEACTYGHASDAGHSPVILVSERSCILFSRMIPIRPVPSVRLRKTYVAFFSLINPSRIHVECMLITDLFVSLQVILLLHV